MSAALRTPFDVSGAATQCDKYGKIGVLVRVEGFEASVVYRIEQLKAKLFEFGNITELPDPWLEVKNLNSWKPLNTVWRISVRPTDALKILELMRLLQKDRGFQCQLDWGGGLIWIGLNVEQANDVASCTQVHESLQALVATLGGHGNLIKSKILSNLDITHFQPLPRAVSIITKTLRQKFDPRGILNPQRMS
jgi:glycolate oxidase FAD binding subunit